MKPFISLNNITVRLKPSGVSVSHAGSAAPGQSASQRILENSSWTLNEGEQWTILGPNGSGKSTLVKALWGGVDLCQGNIEFHFAEESKRIHPKLNKDKIGYVAFELHQNLMAQESWLDEVREFSGLQGQSTKVEEVILSGLTRQADTTKSTPQQSTISPQKTLMTRVHQFMKQLGISHLKNTAISTASTGEMRKILIARALMKKPKLLILDEPFDGLDLESRASLKKSINELMKTGLTTLLITHRVEEIVEQITHIMMIKSGQIFKTGKKEEVLTEENISQLHELPLGVSKSNTGESGGQYHLEYKIEKSQLDLTDFYEKNSEETARAAASTSAVSTAKSQPPLIRMENVTVRYGEKKALDQFNWTFNQGENWCILGPNGSGKSTIVKLITGENLQGYSNEVHLFGHKKGSHESLWDIKKRIGVVSSEVQIQYRKDMSGLDVICSGFYDSIGLYKMPTKEEIQQAEAWAELLEIEGLLTKNFKTLSYGQKRMVLLVRAMVKKPKLLIVDEPCHGLDLKNRINILNLIEKIGETPTHLLYITHHPEEILPCITNVLELERED
jgi:molybdate transport system ATP-binding protein